MEHEKHNGRTHDSGRGLLHRLPSETGMVFIGKWKREIAVLLPFTPRYLDGLYADFRKEV